MGFLPSAAQDAPPRQLDPPLLQLVQPQLNSWDPPSPPPANINPPHDLPKIQFLQNRHRPSPAETQKTLGGYPHIGDAYGPDGCQPAIPGQQPYVQPRETILPTDPSHTTQASENNQPTFALHIPHLHVHQQQQLQQQQQQKQQKQHRQREANDSSRYYKNCNYCRRNRRKCSSRRPCGTCLTAQVSCEYELLPTDRLQDRRSRKRNLNAMANGGENNNNNNNNNDNDNNDENDDDDGEGSSPSSPSLCGHDNDAAAKRHKSGRYHWHQQPRQSFSLALNRVRPRYDIPSHGNCEHCAAGGHEGRDCDANHAEQIECSQCTKYRNLVDANHLCRAGGGEYWQKRFANSRPSYPVNDAETSCCIACRAKRAANKPQMCDIDIQVKIGCTPCQSEGRLCEAYVERRVNGLIPGPPEPWELMWDRPQPQDGSLVPGRRPWWRHLCRGCLREPSSKRWNPCSWANDVRLEPYKCQNCVEKNHPCVDPFTNQEFADGYTWDGQSDCLVIDGRSASRTGQAKCENCKVNRNACRGYGAAPVEFACGKCTSWGLSCVVRRNGQSVRLPHPDRKAIGWTRNTGDTGHLFVACAPCRINRRNCDRKRPCDSCVRFGSECDAFLDGGARMRRDGRVTGADSPDYYMALGYGPDGVDSTRWDVPANALVGPNQPKWVRSEVLEPMPRPVQEEQQQVQNHPAQDLPPRAFGGIEFEEEDASVESGGQNLRRSTKEKRLSQKSRIHREPNPPHTGPRRPWGRPRKVPAPPPPPSCPPYLPPPAAAAAAAPQPTPAENGIGLAYDAFWASHGHGGQGAPWNDNDNDDDNDSTLLNTPGPNHDPQPSPPQSFGDNLAAAKATEAGPDFEKWLSDFNDFNAYEATPLQDQVPAPFEGRPDFDQVQQIVGQEVVMTDADAEELANAVLLDPDFLQMADDGAAEAVQREQVEQKQEEEQGRVLAELRLAVLSLSADQRFIPIELRRYNIPDVSCPPEAVLVPAPERFLLQLDDSNGSPLPRSQSPSPFASVPGESAYMQNLRSLLTRWKKPGWNVLRSIPDVPLAEGNPWYSTMDNNHKHTCEEYQVEPINGDQCRRDVPNTAVCESLEHAVRALSSSSSSSPFMVCDACDSRTKRGLFEGPQPLTRGEFLRMRAYACDGCADREMAAAGFGMPGKPAHPVSGCLCALKLLGRRLCLHHRYRLAKELMVQTMFVSEWAVANFGHHVCLFCKTGPAKTDARGNLFGSLIYLCLNCQGVVAESNTPHLTAGVEAWFDGTVPGSLNEQRW